MKNGIFPPSDKLNPGAEKDRVNQPKEEYIRDVEARDAEGHVTHKKLST